MQLAINISRAVAQERCIKESGEYFWISIGEPADPDSQLDSDFHISFWDVTVETPIIGMGQIFPLSDALADILVKELRQNQETNIIVNCMAGISRSAAVCKFLQDYYDYFWPAAEQFESTYNTHVYKTLIKAYERHPNRRTKKSL